MNRSIAFLAIGLLSLVEVSYAQLRSTDFEIWLYNTCTEDRTIEVTTNDLVWDDDFYLESTLYQGGTFDIEGSYTFEDEGNGAGDYGFVIQTFDSHLTQPYVIDLSYGLYKIAVIYDDGEDVYTLSYFYLDLRDDIGHGSCVDTHLELQTDYSWSWMHSVIDCGEEWYDFNSGTTQTFWAFWLLCEDCRDPWASSTPDRSKFQPANPSSLGLTYVSGHPRLSWSGTPELNGVEKYDVYRKVDNYAFSVVANNISNKYYTDTTVDNFPNNHVITYKIKSVSGDGNIESSGFSNSVYVTGDVQLNKSSKKIDNVTDSGPHELPMSFSIACFPNPFNPSTTIRCGLPEDSNFSLIIYDLRGNVVQTVESDHQSAGLYNFSWNGETAEGETISTGIYFARLVAGDYRQVIKMLYLK